MADNDLKKQFTSILDTARRQAVGVAEEIRTAAYRIRDRLDEEKLRMERRELFERLGEQTYHHYRDKKKRVPELFKDSIFRIDALNAAIDAALAGDDVSGEETDESLPEAGEPGKNQGGKKSKVLAKDPLEDVVGDEES